MKRALIIALPFALAACGGPEASDNPDEPRSSETTDAAPSDRLAGAKLVVSADGIGAKGGQPLRFGSGRSDVDALASEAYGSPGETSSNPECGAGPMEFSQYGPLQIGYLDGKFAGWFLREGDSVVTSDGIRPGITLEALKDERQVQQLDTTLDGEFQYTAADYGTITGFAGEGGTITGLAAGVTCFFR